jgi:hypothetical protein
MLHRKDSVVRHSNSVTNEASKTAITESGNTVSRPQLMYHMKAIRTHLPALVCLTVYYLMACSVETIYRWFRWRMNQTETHFHQLVVAKNLRAMGLWLYFRLHTLLVSRCLYLILKHFLGSFFATITNGLYSGCSNGVPPIHIFQAEHRIQFRSRPPPCDFWAFPTMKIHPQGRNFEVINGLQHVLEKWVERCKKCIACQGRYFEKETVTAPPQSSDSEWVHELCKRPLYKWFTC